MVIDPQTRSVDLELTYSIPRRLQGQVRAGSYVLVPLGKQRVPAWVVELTDDAPPVNIRPIGEKLVDEEYLGEAELGLARWLSERYLCPLSEAVRCFAPPGAGRNTQVTVRITEAGRSAEGDRGVASAPNQRSALEHLREACECSLKELSGVFGGGKEGRRKGREAVANLEEKGLAERIRSLKPPKVRRRTQQFVRLAEGVEEPSELAEELADRAPRQAEVIEALEQAGGEPLMVSTLARGSVRALCDAGRVEVFEKAVERTPTLTFVDPTAQSPPELNPDQAAVVEELTAALSRPNSGSYLIHGVTGSGKTEVYLRTIQAAVGMGYGAIVLVPEIALTPQIVARFESRFGGQLAILHSSLSAGERFDEWQRIRRGDADIVIGARSAIFAPVSNVGVIVVDEEQERAYKQSTAPRYYAPELAAEMSAREGALLVFGSATPSIESYYEAKSGDSDFRLLRLPERVDNRPLPPIQLVDLRRESFSPRNDTFAEDLLETLQECVANDEQAILFLNRRGFSTFVMCRECGFSLRCPHCAVSLIYHHQSRTVRCHHCGHERSVPDQCPNCEGYDIGFQGLGTERVADQVERLVEGAQVLRMDRDTTSRKGAYDRILNQFAGGDANILVGTQMVAKGHDFPNVTVVGVLNADTALNRPDFRAAEQTFQLLTQVSGRAGRAHKEGRVIVQTYNPDHYAIAAASEHDYVRFYSRELATRRENGYPPFMSLVRIEFGDEDAGRALSVANQTAAALKANGVMPKQGDTHFLGPAEAPLHKLRGVFRYHMLLKGDDQEQLCEVTSAAIADVGDTNTTRLIVDVDPTDMM